MSELVSLKLKIFIIPFPENYYYPYSCPRFRSICEEGLDYLELDSQISLVNKPELADIYVLNYVPHIGKDKYNKSFIEPYLNNKKLIVLDVQDECENYLVNENEYLAYFKRSWFNNSHEEIKRPPNFYPINYCMMNDYLTYPIALHKNRPIDISCLLRPDSPDRTKILQAMYTIKQNNPQLNIQVGEVSRGNRSNKEKVTFDDKYFETLGLSKINIHCLPSWYADFRFFESISQACLTFTNQNFDHFPEEKQFIHDKHVVKYNTWNLEDMVNKIGYYLGKPNLINDIGFAGYNLALAEWRSHHLMEYVLKTVKGINEKTYN